MTEEFDRIEGRRFRFLHVADFLRRGRGASAAGACAAERNRGGTLRPGCSRIKDERKTRAVVVVEGDGRVRHSRDCLAEFVTRQIA